MIRSRPACVEDLFSMDLTVHTKVELAYLKHEVLSAIERESVPTETICKNEAPIATVGIGLLWQGVGHVFAVVSNDIKRYPVGFHKEILRLIRKYGERLNLHRLQMVVRQDGDLKWPVALGFKNEGLLEKYGPDGSNFYMFGRMM